MAEEHKDASVFYWYCDYFRVCSCHNGKIYEEIAMNPNTNRNNSPATRFCKRAQPSPVLTAQRVTSGGCVGYLWPRMLLAHYRTDCSGNLESVVSKTFLFEYQNGSAGN
jgi:hypothetical protein